jgi:site-specific DNA-methyltransferase (adenine-specific)
MSATWVTGNTLDVLRKLPDDSVDLVLTSPPFLALRSYLPADHPDKAHEIGSESTPGEFLDVLLDVTEELARVLAPHGSICVELGDTYSAEGPGWPDAKSLCLIPELYRFALAYGFNPLTGRETPRWRVRNVIRWVRPNPPVGALGDKFRPATSEMVVACKAKDRYFDLDAVRETHADPFKEAGRTQRWLGAKAKALGHMNGTGKSNPAGAPPLDWWNIPTQPYKGAHYASYPEALCVRPIKAMCPERVCRTCGEPSRRIVGDVEWPERERDPLINDGGKGGAGHGTRCRPDTTLGWSDCEHDNWRTGIALDPFAGSGTTLAVAVGHGRHAIGIDLDPLNLDLARERVGMWLTEVPAEELGGVA